MPAGRDKRFGGWVGGIVGGWMPRSDRRKKTTARDDLETPRPVDRRLDKLEEEGRIGPRRRPSLLVDVANQQIESHAMIAGC